MNGSSGKHPEMSVIKIVIGILGVLGVLSVGSVCYISVTQARLGSQVQIPEGLLAIATGLTGVLGGILAKTALTHTEENPQPVQIVNKPKDPVPVTEDTTVTIDDPTVLPNIKPNVPTPQEPPDGEEPSEDLSDEEELEEEV